MVSSVSLSSVPQRSQLSVVYVHNEYQLMQLLLDFNDHYVVIEAYVVFWYSNHVVSFAAIGHHVGESVS